jgi:hypothetical protein
VQRHKFRRQAERVCRPDKEKIKDGIAQNMNATFLMKKTGISGEED